MTYFEISLRFNLSSCWHQLLGKAYRVRYLNGAIVSDSYKPNYYHKDLICETGRLLWNNADSSRVLRSGIWRALN